MEDLQRVETLTTGEFVGVAAPPIFLICGAAIAGSYVKHRRVHALIARTQWFVLLALLVLALPLITQAPMMLGYPHQLDFGEPFTYRGAWLLAQGRSPYVPWEHPVGGIAALYPPVFTLAVAGLLRVFEPGIHLARAFTACCGTVLLALIWRYVHARTRVWTGPAAACLFILGADSARFFVLGRADVPALLFAVAAVITALSGMEAGGRIPASRLAASAALCVAALLTKQSFVAAPAAITLYLLVRREWRRAALFTGACGLPLVAATALLDWMTGGRYVFIVYRLQGYFALSLQRSFEILLAESIKLSLLAVVPAAFYLYRTAQEPRTRLLIIYAALASAQLITIGKVGSSYNYLLEVHALLAILLGLSFHELRLRPASLVAGAMLAGAVVPLAADHGAAAAQASELADRRVAEVALAHVLDRHPGPMLTSEPYQAIERHQPDNVVEWLVHRLPLPGSDAGWARLADDLGRQAYAAIVVSRNSSPAADAATEIAWNPAVQSALHARYRNLRAADLSPAEQPALQRYWILVPCTVDCGLNHFEPLAPRRPGFYRRVWQGISRIAVGREGTS